MSQIAKAHGVMALPMLRQLSESDM